MLASLPANTPVEHVIEGERSTVYAEGVVISYTNGSYVIHLKRDGLEARCSSAAVRPKPPPSAVDIDILQPGDSVDLYDPSTCFWRSMVSMQHAGFPLQADQELVLLQPGTLNINKYTTPRLRRGLVYVPGTNPPSWQPRTGAPACLMLSSKSVALGAPWKYSGVLRRKPPEGPAMAAAVSGASATPAGDACVTYRVKTTRSTSLGRSVNPVTSTHQAVVARAYDLRVGKPCNFTDAEWDMVKQHLQLEAGEEPYVLPDPPPAAAGASQAALSQWEPLRTQEASQASLSGVGAKRGWSQSSAQDAPPTKQSTTQHQQRLLPSATGSRQDHMPAGGAGGLQASASIQGREQGQQMQGLHLQQEAAAPMAPTPTPGAKAAVGGQGAADGGVPAAADAAQESLARLSLQQQQQQQQQQQEQAGAHPAGACDGSQQRGVGNAGLQRLAAGGSKQATGRPAAAAKAGAAAAAAPAVVVDVWGPGQVVVLTLMSLDRIPVRLGTYKLRILRKLGAGGQCSVWLVELQGDSSNAVGGSGIRTEPSTPAAGGVGTAGGGAGSAAASAVVSGSAASPFKPMQQLMALKVPPPWALCSADKKRQHGREDRYKANMLDNILKECSLLARCQDRAIVETFGWGMVQLDSPGPEQQSHTAPAGGAACTSSSSSSSASQLSATLQLPGMLLEYAKNGTLAHQLRSCPPGTGLSPRAAKVYIQRVTRALVYLHEEHAMCHRDIKPDNCLLFEEAPILFRPRTPEDSLPQHKICVMKLADLGIAKVFQNRGAPCSSTQSYTPSYRAPEMQEGLAHDLRIDTFAVGLLLIHLRTALPPFLYLELTPGLSPEEKEARRGAEELAREDCPYRQVLTPGELEFASVCLERNVLKRPHLVHLEEHPYYHL